MCFKKVASPYPLKAGAFRATLLRSWSGGASGVRETGVA